MNESDDIVRYPRLARIATPDDVRKLDSASCVELAEELRHFIVNAVQQTGGHLGSNLGAVETTIALHRVFHSPRDVILFDTGHQAYVHKLLTGRMEEFDHLRQANGLSGYPSRAESDHDWIENSHASTSLSYAHGIAHGFRSTGDQSRRRVVVLVGDGALTGGMAYEALNNLGHSSSRVLIVLNDNGRSYAPTVSKLSESLTQLRLSPSLSALRQRIGQLAYEIPGVGNLAGPSLKNLASAVRELVEPHVFFEALGIRYAGPIDGHNINQLEQALKKAATWDGPIVLHVLTQKGKGYGPAEEDEIQHLHDLKAQLSPLAAPGTTTDRGAIRIGPRSAEKSYTDAFSQAVVEAAKTDSRVVAITAAMPGPTGLLPFEALFPDRFLDVGIAEQHAMTAAAGMSMAGMRPVVAIYSTFLSRAFDQQNLDVGLHRCPVVICADRAGITGEDGPSHHGILDMVLSLAIPGTTIFAPSEPGEVGPMLKSALELDTPTLIRYPKTPGPVHLAEPGTGLEPRILRQGSRRVVVVGIGKLAEACLRAAKLLSADRIDPTVVDLRVVRPLHESVFSIIEDADLIITAEDGLVHGGAGQHLREEIERRALELTSAAAPRVVCLGIPTTYIAQGKPDEILSGLGLDGEGIAESIRRAIEVETISSQGSDLNERTRADEIRVVGR